MMGRYRRLEEDVCTGRTMAEISHGLRAAINTPIQGGAADFVIAAMVKVSKDQLLHKLGYKLLL